MSEILLGAKLHLITLTIKHARHLHSGKNIEWIGRIPLHGVGSQSASEIEQGLLYKNFPVEFQK